MNVSLLSFLRKVTISGNIVDRIQIDGIGEVLIRYPEMDDAEDLLDYTNSVIDEGVLALDEEKDMDWEVESLADTLKDIERGQSIALVVEVGGEVMGMGNISKDSGALSHTGELGFGLKEEIRGRGIGTELMRILLREAVERLDLEIVKLEVYRTNEPALSLYKKVGFEKVGTIEDGGFQNGNYKDVVIMKKDLRRDYKYSKSSE